MNRKKSSAVKARHLRALQADPVNIIRKKLDEIAPMLPPIPSDTGWAPNHELYAKYLSLPVSLRDMIELLNAQKTVVLPDEIRDQLYALEVRYCYIESQYNKRYGVDPEA